MADVTYTSLEGGDLFNAASLTSRFTGITAAVNDVEAAAVDRGAFNAAHLPSLIVNRQTQAFIGAGGGGDHLYTETQVVHPAYLTIDTNGGAGGGTDLQVNFAPVINFAVAQESEGMLVMFEAHVVQITDSAGGSGASQRYAGFRLQASNPAGAWVTITRSEHFVADALSAGSRDQHFPIAIRCLIRAGDVAGDQVAAVRAQISMSVTGGAPVTQVILREVSLAALVLHADKATP